MPHDWREQIPPTVPKEPTSTSKPLSPATIHHMVIQVGGTIPQAARVVEVDARWIRVECSTPVEVKVNDQLVVPGKLDNERSIYTGEAAPYDAIFQGPISFEYRGTVSKIAVNRLTLAGADPSFADLVHIYWSTDPNVKVERGRPHHYVTEIVIPAGWVLPTFVDFMPLLNSFQGPAPVQRMWPIEAEVLAVGVEGDGVYVAAFRLLSVRLVWVDPAVGTAPQREFYRVMPPNVATSGSTELNYEVEFATPRRLPILGMLRNNPGAAWQLRYMFNGNGFPCPQDIVVSTEWRAV